MLGNKIMIRSRSSTRKRHGQIKKFRYIKSEPNEVAASSGILIVQNSQQAKALGAENVYDDRQ